MLFVRFWKISSTLVFSFWGGRRYSQDFSFKISDICQIFSAFIEMIIMFFDIYSIGLVNYIN
jgi:hypothetical protein